MENTHLPPLKFSAIFSSSLAVAKKKFFPALGLLLFVAIVNSAANEFTYGLGTILLFPLTIGIMLFFLRSVRGEAAPMSSVFDPFKQYFRMLWGYLRVLLFTLLWALPGIALSAGAFLWIGADATRHEYSNLQLLKLLPPVILLAVTLLICFYRYGATYYIMLDEPSISVREAMQKSIKLMYGHKLQMFGYTLALGLIAWLTTAVIMLLAFFLGKIWWLMMIVSVLIFVLWSIVIAAFTATYYAVLRSLVQATETFPAPENTEDSAG